MSEVPGDPCSSDPGLCSTYTGLTEGGSSFGPQLKRTQAVLHDATGFPESRTRQRVYQALVSQLPCSKYYRNCKIGDDEGRSKAAKIYPDLAHLLVGQGDQEPVFTGRDD